MNKKYKVCFYICIVCCLLGTSIVAQTTINNGACNTGISIPDNNCVDVSINVVASGNVLGQDIFLTEARLIMTHDWRADVEMTLTTPNDEASLLLIDRRGGTGDNWGLLSNGNCTQPMVLSDDGCAVEAINRANKSSDAVGRYTPEQSFADLYSTSNIDPNGIWNLRVCDQKSINIGTLDHFELVFAPVGCTAPSNITFSSITASSIDLAWMDNNACVGNVIIEYGPVGFTPSNGASSGSASSQVVSLNCTEDYVLTGLAEATEYDVYIRQSCGTTSYLYNSCKISFLTDCDVPPATLSEDFNNQTNCDGDGNCISCPTLSGVWRNSIVDSIDWIVNSGPTVTSRTGPSDDISGGGQYIYIESSFDCKLNKEAVLISDCINVVANAGTCHLSFYYHLFGVDINQLKLEGSTDGATWTNLWQQNGNQGDKWYKVYVDLSPFNNQVMQFRFVGNSTADTKPYGDIGLDQIEFYGPQVQPTDVRYADKDNDGFGDPNDSLSICFLVQPAGYVVDNTDCDDTNAAINPGAAELPCNLTDENCNGNADEQLILNPIAAISEVCSGTTATLEVQPANNGTIYWYNSASGGMPIDSGQLFTTPILMDTTIYYAQEIKDSLGQNCESDLIPVSVFVNPQPDISNASGPQSVCQATDFDLKDLIIQDANNATDTILFYSSDTYSSNSLISPNVSISSNTIYYIQAVSSTGCIDQLSVAFTIETTPVANITAPDTMKICFQSSPELILANNIGAGVAPFSYEWNIGTQNEEAIVFSRTKDFFQTYAVTITSANGCNSSDSIVVHTLPSLSSVEVVNIQEPGFCQTNGAIDIAPRDGLAPYGYVWNGPSFGITNNSSSSVYNIPSLPMGAYNITVTDAYGCNKVLPQQIVNGPDLSIDNVVDVTCHGDPNGAIHLTVGGLINPSFQWTDESNNPIATSEDLVNFPAGIYNVIVDSDNTQPCPLDSIVIKEPAPLEILNIITSEPSCTGIGDGTIDLTLTGGTPINGDYNYAWSNGLPNTNNPTNLSPGIYDATITDAQGCSTTAASIINATPALVASTNGIDPTCVNGDDGQLTVNVSGGNTPYTYQWNDPFQQNTATAFALKTAIYDVTVTDANDCEQILRDTLFQPPGLFLNIQNITNPSCAGANDGVIDVFVNGGTAPYAYLWNTGATIDRIVSVEEAFYSVSITDANDCIAILDSIELDAPEVMDIDFINIQVPICKGVSDGAVDITVNGGVAPYRYSWNTGTGSKDLRNIPEGNYMVTVTDDNNCRTVSDTLQIVAPQGITINDFLVVDSILCKDMDNGVVFMNVLSDAPGANNYIFTWKDSSLVTDNSTGFWLSSDFTTLSAGIYNLEIQDNIGCTLETSFTLPEPDYLMIDTILMETPSCYGSEDGSIVANVSGGTEPYIYSWLLPNNSVQRTNQGFLQNISGGNYMLQIIDANGCISNNFSFVLEEPSAINITAASNDPVGCAEPENGLLDIVANGGRMPYNYEWSSGLTSRSINDLDAGFYTVTLTDATGCDAIETFNVGFEENGLQIDIVSITDKSCTNSNDGAITIAVSGGLGIYQYVWSNGVQVIANDTMELTNLGAGNYSVSVVDENEDFLCRGALEDIVISSGGSLSVRLDNLTNELECFGDDNGAYAISVNGGTGPYSYEWSNGSNMEDQANLSAGDYSLTIEDVNNCIWVSDNFFPPITSPTNPLSANALTTTPVLCAGESNGSIALSINGGMLPYQYNWNTGATTSTIQNLPAGNYTVTISDRNGCSVRVDTSIVLADEALIVNLVASTSDCTNNDLGSIETNVTCGMPPYQYNWNTGANTPNLDNLVTGEYEVTVTDANSNQVIKSVELRGASQLQLDGVLMEHRNCGGYIDLTISGGVANSYAYTWRNENNELITTSAIAANLPVGTYSTTITDANSCTLEAGPFVINSISAIESVLTDVDFSAPSALGTVRIESITGGIAPYTFIWLDENGGILSNDSIVRGVPVGNYTVRVIDANGCSLEVGQLVTSVKDIQEVASFAIFPNPAKDYALVEAVFTEKLDVVVDLFDAVGRQVSHQSYKDLTNLSHTIDFTNLPTGIFYIKLSIEDYSPVGQKIIHLR